MDSGQRARASLAVFSRHRVVRFVRMKFPPRPLPPPPTPRQFINPTDDRVRRPTPRYIYIYIKGEVLVVSPPIILLVVIVTVARIRANRGHELGIFRNRVRTTLFTDPAGST